MAQIQCLSETLQNVAIKELNEVPENIENVLNEFKLWLQQQPHLKARTDDQFLIQFLRSCEYNMDRAKERIDAFYSLKTAYPQMLGIYDVENEKFREINRLGCFTALPRPFEDTGSRMIWFDFNYSTEEYTTEEIFYPGLAMYELFIIDDPHAAIQGIMTILDMSKASMAHLLQASPLFLKTMVDYFENCLPLRIRGIYFFNIPAAANNFFKMLLSLFSEKNRNRVFLCETMDDLMQHIPQKYLPRHCGGENGSLEENIQVLEEKFNKYSNYFKENSHYGTDESLRQGPPLNVKPSFGDGGSFRKLAVD
ncbi:alpha-tocopherol transfer protein-like [Musca autumnalis]|uniref:alpha-tocopherol transfer protein-like n=1 Tax=Musca autumnalis TaxID=221902 RepID=UPI003CEADA3F